MKYLLSPVLALAVLCSLPAFALSSATQDTTAPEAKAPAADRPISRLAWLVDGVWTADASGMGNGMKRIETRYRWSDNSAFIRFTTHFVTDKAELKTYDGNFFWNASKAMFGMWYMDAKDAITEGPIAVQGDTTEMSFEGQDFEGKAAHLRVQVARKNNDLYRWILAEQQDGAWKQLAALDYARR